MENRQLEQKEKINIIKKGSKLIATCIDYNHEAQGICKVNGIKDDEEVNNFPLFVTNMIPGEKGQIEITKLTKSYGFAKIIKIFNDTRSLNRVYPECPNYHQCGGCNIMHLNYKSQLEFKTNMVETTIKKIGGIENIKVETIIGMSNPNNYRNKVQVPFRKDRFKTVCGFFARDSHNVIQLDKCLIQPEISTEIVKYIKNLCNELKIDGYNEYEDKGLIKHCLVRSSCDLKSIMVVLVLTTNELPHQKEFIEKVVARYPQVKSIIININNKKGNKILGDKCLTIYGKDYIEDKLCDLKFRLGPKSFYQVNHQQTEKLYNTAIDIANLSKDDVIVDAYCGIGTIGLIASKSVKEVYSVEIVDEAIKNAKINAKANKITNVHFVCNKAEEQIKEWKKSNIQIDAIFVDPPRKGCDKILLDTIEEMQINKIVYISCDPATLARDLNILKNKNYEMKKIQLIDMFPYTSNVETIVLLSHKSNNSKVNIKS